MPLPKPRVPNRLLRDRDLQVVCGLVLAGVALRLAFMSGIRPIVYGLNDSGTYMAAANGYGFFFDVHHATGYSMFLSLVSPVVQTGVGLAVLQHAMGLAGGVLLYYAGRAFGGPRWAAAVCAGAYLLSIDIVALEHSILSEALFLPLVCVVVFAAARLYRAERSRSILLFAALLGAASAISYTARYTGGALFMAAPLLALALPSATIRTRLLSATTTAAVVVAIVGSYVVAQDRALGIGLSPFPGHGWNKYTALAPGADCSRFTPPPGTRVLCESATQRAGKSPEFYSWDPASPARRLEARGFPYSDAKFSAFADAVEAGAKSGSQTSQDPGFLDRLLGIPDNVGGWLTSTTRHAGTVYGSASYFADLRYQSLVVEANERVLAAGLLELPPMTFHAPIQPLQDLRPFMRVTGPTALIALLIAFIALPRMGRRRAAFCVTMMLVMLAWTIAGQLPRYSIPTFVLSLSLLPVAASTFQRGREPSEGGKPEFQPNVSTPR